MKSDSVDVLIIGAGPSGTIASSILNQEGFKVRIIEKQRFPRFMIGESLLPKCMDAFKEAGLIDIIKEKEFQTKNGAKFLNGSVSCDFDFNDKSTEGWDWTWQVPRAEFDKVLADEMEKRGVEIEYGTALEQTNIKENGSSTSIVVDDQGNRKEIEANFIIDASGNAQVLAKQLGLSQPSDFPVRSSMFAHIKDSDRPEDVEADRTILIVHELDVWAWIIPFSNGITSFGFVGAPRFFKKFEGSPEERLRSMIAENEHTRDRFLNPEFVEGPKEINAYSTSVKKLHGKGFALTGNSAEFLDPVFSSGVTFATESGSLAAKLAAKELKGEKVDWNKEYDDHIEQGVDTFRSYVRSWYNGDLQRIFFAPNINMDIKSKICSVLAGYVWDTENPFVQKHDRAISTLAKVVQIEAK